MGMFDFIKCELKLPFEEVQDDWFQTKGFDNMMHKYTITKDGKLVYHTVRTEYVPDEERPYYGTPEWEQPIMRMCGCMRDVPIGDIFVHSFTDSLRFYTILNNEWWYECNAKFVKGVVCQLHMEKRPLGSLEEDTIELREATLPHRQKLTISTKRKKAKNN